MPTDIQDEFSTAPVLELLEARPWIEDVGLAPSKYTFSLRTGECALIECHDAHHAAFFTDLCVGMRPLADGVVRCLGLDWQKIEEKRRWALRGRVGRISRDGGWIDLYGTHMNILWPSLHHTRTKIDVLTRQAVELCTRFGLPGLPTQSPTRLSELDLRRAGYVRAFMGEPDLLLLEEPVQLYPKELHNAFLIELTAARQRGCAVIWLSSDRAVWRGYGEASMQYFRLSDTGLAVTRRGV